MSCRHQILSGSKLSIIIRRQLESSSLVEVLVAIAVCMIVFSLAMAILLKVDRENNIRLKLKGDFLLEKLVKELPADPIPGVDTLKIDGVIICRSILPANRMTDVLEITHQVFSNNGTPLSVTKFLIHTEKNNEQEFK